MPGSHDPSRKLPRRTKPRRKGEPDVIGLYLRVSTVKQQSQSQQDAIEKWCKVQRYPSAELKWYIDEGVSGKTIDRPEFQKMMVDAENGVIDRIITFELSRLSRDLLDLLDVMRKLTVCGVAVEVPGEGPVRFDSTIQQFLVAAKGLAAAEERERLAVRTKAGMAAARARGARLGPPKGSKNRLGKVKDYASEDPQLVKTIFKLDRDNKTSAEIVADVKKFTDKTVGQSKVLRILRWIKATSYKAT